MVLHVHGDLLQFHAGKIGRYAHGVLLVASAEPHGLMHEYLAKSSSVVYMAVPSLIDSPTDIVWHFSSSSEKVHAESCTS
jgi:hypothetical protein